MSIKIKIFGNKLGTEKNTSEDLEDNKSIESYELSAFRGSSVKEHEIEINEDEVTEFQFSDETVWYAKTDEIAALFGSQTRSNEDVIEIPTHLSIPSGDRNFAEKILVKAIQIFKPKAIEYTALKLASTIEKAVEEYEGLNFITEDFEMLRFADGDQKSKRYYDEKKPFLLFIHGTGSSTLGSFSKLKGSDSWTSIHEKYGNNILALEHRTISQSPLQNAVDLMTAIPANLTLHMVSHSRGGIVGDILTRCGDRSTLFSESEMEHLREARRTTDDESEVIADVEHMKALNKLALAKNIKIEKFVRVACPAAGTRILSKRLDILLNVMLNLMGQGPIRSGIKAFLKGVADQRNDPRVLPGLEAMVPDSPFLEVINGLTYKTNTELRIIAGSAAAKGAGRTLLYILTRLYYWRDNDYIVDTDSMFLGAKTHSTPQYLFVTGKEVDHISYFENQDTQEAVLNALATEKGKSIPHFKLVKEGEQNRSILNLPGGAVLQETPTGKKPIVVLLPGTMGSNLYDKNDVIWIDFVKMAFGALKKLDLENKNISAKSLVETSYGKFIQRLQNHFDVVSFPYDWRKSLSVSGAELNKKIQELLLLNQPIHLVGHSMGGLVIRDLMINHSKTWIELSENSSFRCLLLGTPWRGSYLIPEIITGQGATIKKLNKLAVLQSKKRLLEVFSRYNGLLELLPLFGHDFEDINLWKSLHKVTKGKGWVLPDKADLAKFKTYKETILSALGDIEGGKVPKLDLSKVYYVVGKSESTASNFYFDVHKKGREYSTDPDAISSMNPRRTDLAFDQTGAGDGSVAWEPTLKGFKKDNVYYVDTTHGELANDEKRFDGFIELLETGSTQRFSQSKPSVSPTTSRGVLTADHIMSNNPKDLVLDILGLKRDRYYDYQIDEKRSKLKVIAKNGSLKYSSYPVLIGHFKDDGIVSAERDMNFLLDNELLKRHDIGIYPSDIETNLVILPAKDKKHGVVIAGLGENEKLTPYLLSRTIEKSCLAYLFALKNAPKTDKPLGISSLFVGSGYGSLSLSESINAILEGISSANSKIQKLDQNLATIKVVEFFELYKFKMVRAFYTLKQMEEGNNMYNISLESSIRNVGGAKTNIPVNEMSSWWVRITALLEENKETGEVLFNFSAASGRARVSSRKVFTSHKILNALLEESSHDKQWNPELAKTIFELLIPNDMKLFFRNQQNILLILDKDTAKYPWELLHYDVNASKPICVNAGMIRQLSTVDDKRIINPITKRKALVIGDPLLVGSDLTQLPAAKDEAEKVDTLLTEKDFDTTCIIRGAYKDIVIKLFDEYKVIHIASHGVVDYGDGPIKETGILLSDNIVLSTKEISQRSSTPELVFINSCFMGDINASSEAHYRKKYKLAANIGTQFIEDGVKAVVVAGWAVDDNAALEFAETFYAKMLAGATFGDAVKAARSSTYEKYRDTNTWGAYHAYGDQFYKLTNWKSGVDKDRDYVSEIEIMIDLEDFINGTKDAETRGKTKNQKMEIQAKLETISEKIDRSKLRNTEITEEEAKAYGEIELYEKAIGKYESLLSFDNAKFSIRSLEQLNNLRAVYVTEVKLALDADDKMSKKDKDLKVKELQATLTDVLGDLGSLNKLGKTQERLSLLGSAYKRNVFLLSASKKRTALKMMSLYYKRAFLLKNDGLADKRVYPLTNWLIAEVLLVLDNKDKPEVEDKRIKNIQDLFNTSIEDFLLVKLKEIKKSENDVKDFWDLVQGTNVLSLQLMFADTAKKHQELVRKIKADYKLAWKTSGSHRSKKSELVHFEFLKDYLNAIGSLESKRKKVKVSLMQNDDTIRYKKKEIVSLLKKSVQELINFYRELE